MAVESGDLYQPLQTLTVSHSYDQIELMAKKWGGQDARLTLTSLMARGKAGESSSRAVAISLTRRWSSTAVPVVCWPCP